MSSSGCEDTKGLMCPSLAHALHSQFLRSLREEGPWKERSLPLGPEPGLPLCQPHLGDAWCSGSLLQRPEMTIQTPLNWEKAGPGQRVKSGLRVKRGQGPLQTLEVAGKTAAVRGGDGEQLELTQLLECSSSLTFRCAWRGGAA